MDKKTGFKNVSFKRLKFVFEFLFIIHNMISLEWPFYHFILCSLEQGTQVYGDRVGGLSNE